MKVLFLAFMGRKLASARIRAWNMADAWDEAECSNLVHRDLAYYDFFVFQKTSISHDTIELAKAIKLAGKHIIWDICDPIWWWYPASDFLALAKYCSAFVVISKGLQEDLKRDMGIDSVVIPDRLPFRDGWKVHKPVEEPVMGWCGHSSNRIPVMYGMGIVWNRLAIDEVKCKVRLIDENPHAGQIKATPNYEHMMEYEEFNWETEHEQMMRCDVALVPPYPLPWGRMKGEIKSTVASWAGLPVTDGNNYPALKKLLKDWTVRQYFGQANRAEAEDLYEIHKSVDQYKELLESIERKDYEPLGTFTGVDTARIGYP